MGWQPFKKPFKSFTPAKAVSNAFKVTPESFRPGNIIRTGTTAGLVIGTGGVGAVGLSTGLAVPFAAGNVTTTPFSLATLGNIKIANTPITSSDPNKASIVGAAAAGVYSFGTVKAGNPSEPETLVNKISRLLGGAAGSYGGGKIATGVLYTDPASHALPAGVEGPTQPLSIGERFGNFLGNTVQTTSTAYGTGQFAQSVLGIFGKQVGGAILQLVSGDVAGAIKTITTPSPSTPSTTVPSLFGNYQSGGGGGSGLGVGVNSGQSTTNPLVFPIMGIAVLFVVWLIVRKK